MSSILDAPPIAAEEKPPWKTLSKHIKTGDGDAALELLREVPPSELLYVLGRLRDKKLTALWQLLIPIDLEFAADLLQLLPDVLAANLIEQLPTETAATLLSRVDSDEQVDFLATMDSERSAEVIEAMGSSEAADIKRYLSYPHDTAGGLMVSEILTFSAKTSVSSVVDFFRKHHDQFDEYVTRYLFAVDEHDRFVGVVKSRTLLTASPSDTMAQLAVSDFSVVSPDVSVDELESLFDGVDHMAVPVVADDGTLLGAVKRSAVFEVLQERDVASLMRFGGIVGGEELRTMPLRVRTFRRLMFLLPSIGLSYIAVSVITIYEPIIEKATVLAVFLPMVANLCGAAGNQAVAVSIRELTLGLIDGRDLLRVWGQEFFLALFNGVAIASVLAAVVFCTRGDTGGLPLVIGAAYTLSSVVAVGLGSGLPLLMNRLGIDPAMLSSPVLTTLTDMTSFFLVLSLAAAILDFT
ncbi:magnesium transporter [Rhodopirellula sallentina]|uniref:Magnesium transporter n=1 Tax=Rhodopirellula sallentina SM41 TaxID=1263870 RepID=M5U432_9BACT|nr:magnesium transporter [Rhodopirellula sallentina]EMI56039.1 magnesium transporter [Rhodopirellula sallentina SM41]